MATDYQHYISRTSPGAHLLTILFGLVLLFASVVNAQDSTPIPTTSTSTTTSPPSPTSPPSSSVEPTTANTTTTTTNSKKIISLFYLNENAYSGLPFDKANKAYGEVVGVDDTATTYVFTTTRILKPETTSSSTTDVLFTTGEVDAGTTLITLTVPSTKATAIPVPGFETMASEPSSTSFVSDAESTAGSDSDSGSDNTSHNGVSVSPVSYIPSSGSPTTGPPASSDLTGVASTITQGPKTFEFTGVPRFPGANHTVINRCQLKRYTEANCTVTHIGEEWYATMSDWDGVFRTRTYSWMEGDRMGFAPVTMTAGLEMLRGDDEQENDDEDDDENGASGMWKGGDRGSAFGRFGAVWMGLFTAAVVVFML